MITAGRRGPREQAQEHDMSKEKRCAAEWVANFDKMGQTTIIMAIAGTYWQRQWRMRRAWARRSEKGGKRGEIPHENKTALLA